MEKAEFFRYRGSSNKLFDCLATAKPAIFAIDAPNHSFQEVHCDLIAQSRDAQALAEDVSNLNEMLLKERKTMRRRGREYVEKYHAILMLAEKLDEVLHRAVYSL